jgi:molybdate transport system ATP-binding protein
MRPTDLNDIAARVGVLPYDSSDGLDAAVAEAVDRLRARGIAVAGLLQRFGDAAPGGKQAMWVEDIASGQVIRLDQPRGPGAIACTFDTGALARAAYLLQVAAESGAELLVVNRFGGVEAEGHGLRSEIAEAICSGLAVLIPIRASLLPALEAFLGGPATCLPASAAAIEAWAEALFPRLAARGRSTAVVA